jgi:hypothetical protein
MAKIINILMDIRDNLRILRKYMTGIQSCEENAKVCPYQAENKECYSCQIKLFEDEQGRICINPFLSAENDCSDGDSDSDPRTDTIPSFGGATPEIKIVEVSPVRFIWSNRAIFQVTLSVNHNNDFLRDSKVD